MSLDLNYNHLHYFWHVAREGSVVAAARELLVSQPAISSQIRDLERSLKVKLFERSGRGLKLTEAGRVVYRHADEMFAAGQNLVRALGRPSQATELRIVVGVADAVPKELVCRMLSPALELRQRVRIICREDKADRLLVDLAANRLDLVLADAPLGASAHVRGTNHLLVECGVSFMGTAEMAKHFRKGFPKSLEGAPLLLPSDVTHVRAELLEWLETTHRRPTVAGEFDDAATMASFGRRGLGIFPVPTAMEKEIAAEYRVKAIGHTDQVQYRFYAVASAQQRTHPAVVAVCGG